MNGNVRPIRPIDALRAIEAARNKSDNSAHEPPTGGGAGDPPMEARIAKLEATMGHVQGDVTELKADVRELRRDVSGIRTTDFRILFGAFITGMLGLAGVMAKGFGWI